jgi:hypothetical protein
MAREQLSFPFEGPNPPAQAPAEEKKPAYDFVVEDECTYCGAPFESERSCKYCESNHIKKVYLKKQSGENIH